MKCPTDIEWTNSPEWERNTPDDNYCPPVTPFPGSKYTICLDGLDCLAITPNSFPVILQIEVNGEPKTIRIEEANK